MNCSGALVTVVSAGRPGSVALWRSHGLTDVTWVVPKHQHAEYVAAGAERLVNGSDRGVSFARNAALRAAWRHDLICLMLDDDPEHAYEINHTTRKARPVDWQWWLSELLRERAEHDVRLAVGSHITNTLHVNNAVSHNVKISGNAMAIAPCDVMFDTKCRVGEDMDYGLQHWEKYGDFVRVDRLAYKFTHLQPGGCTTYRDRAEEERNLVYLKSKWGNLLVHRATKVNEFNIFPKLPKRQRELLT